MSVNKRVRSISFNRTNDKDVARLHLIGKKSFSRFIKRLLDEEIARQDVLPSDARKPPVRKQKAPVRTPPTVFNPMLKR